MRRVWMTGGALVVLLVTGCAAKATGSASASGASASGASASTTSVGTSAVTSPAAAVPDGEFRVVSLVGHELVPGTSIVITFTGSQLSARAGCNTMGGEYTTDVNGVLQVQLSMTEMGCEPALMDQDSWVAGFLGAEPYVRVDGDTITVNGRGIVAESMVLQRVSPLADAPLEGVTWQLETIITGETASSVPSGVTPTLEIVDGRIVVDTSCNGLTGNVAAIDQTLVLTDMFHSDRSCDSAAAAMQALLVREFAGTIGFSIAGDRLAIVGATGKQLVFTATAGAGVTVTQTDEPLTGVGTDVLVVPSKDASTTPDNSIPAIPEPTG